MDGFLLFPFRSLRSHQAGEGDAMSMKGDMSLELIVKFVILLVAAAIIIAMLIDQLPGGGSDVLNQDKITDEQSIKTSCQQVCDRWKRSSGTSSASAAVEYCTERFSYDADGDSTVSGQFAGAGHNSYCQDGVHCFNLHECRSTQTYQTLDAATCVEIMCDYYQNPEIVDTSAVDPNQRVEDFFAQDVAEDNRGAGTCNIGSATDATGSPINTWWSNDQYQLNDNPCSDIS